MCQRERECCAARVLHLHQPQPIAEHVRRIQLHKSRHRVEARIADNPSLLELLCCSTSVIVVIVQRAEKVGKEARDVLRARDEIATCPAAQQSDVCVYVSETGIV